MFRFEDSKHRWGNYASVNGHVGYKKSTKLLVQYIYSSLLQLYLDSHSHLNSFTLALDFVGRWETLPGFDYARYADDAVHWLQNATAASCAWGIVSLVSSWQLSYIH